MSEQYDVVMVGAGPGGLAGALTLGSYGVSTLVVERRAEPSTLPRSTSVSTGTMELLRRWGLEPAARRRAVDVDLRMLACPTLARAAEGQAVEVGIPTIEQAAVVSPSAPAALAQDELEPLLEQRLRAFPAVRVQRGVELVQIGDHTNDGLELVLDDADGSRRTVSTRYLVGADGLRSGVRRGLGIGTTGQEALAERLAITFRAPAWDVVGDARYGGYFLTDDALGRFFIPLGRPDRWVLGMNWPDDGRDVARISSDRAREWIRGAAGAPELPIAIDRMAPVVYGVAVADSFRAGRAFLIGDAAHRVTPRGGTGLNSAIRDGFDLGWKLAWVLRGWAGDALLDTYEEERRPVAEHNAARSARDDGSLLQTALGLSVDIGGRLPHVWAPRGDELVSTLDMLGEGLTLFTGPAWAGSAPPAGSGSPPVAVQSLDAISARALGLGAEGSLLVRPDGHPVALRNHEAGAALASA